MATKKVSKNSKAQNKQYVMNSNVDGDAGPILDSMEQVTSMLENQWDWYENEIVTVYELVPVKKYKKGPSFVEVK